MYSYVYTYNCIVYVFYILYIIYYIICIILYICFIYYILYISIIYYILYTILYIIYYIYIILYILYIIYIIYIVYVLKYIIPYFINYLLYIIHCIFYISFFVLSWCVRDMQVYVAFSQVEEDVFWGGAWSLACCVFFIVFVFRVVFFVLPFDAFLLLPHCCEAVAVPEAGYGQVCFRRCMLKLSFFYIEYCIVVKSFRLGRLGPIRRVGALSAASVLQVGLLLFVWLFRVCFLRVCLVLFGGVCPAVMQVLCFVARRAWISVWNPRAPARPMCGSTWRWALGLCS